MIPKQPAGRELCCCQHPIHLTNTNLGVTWVHDAGGSEWCGEAGQPAEQRAEPVGVTR